MAPEGNGRKAEGREVDMNALLQKLKLSEAEKEGVFLAKEDRDKLPNVKWMAVAKLLTTKKYSDASLITTMKSTWNWRRTCRSAGSEKKSFCRQGVFLR